jgi:hypothetical protein
VFPLNKAILPQQREEVITDEEEAGRCEEGNIYLIPLHQLKNNL